MTTRRRTARRPSGSAGRPRLTWRAFSEVAQTLVGGTNLVVPMTTAGPAPDLSALGVFGDYTIRRVRWSLGLQELDAENTNGAFQVVFWGMTVVSNDALASGVGAIPDPVSDPADWFGYGTAMYQTLDTGKESVAREYQFDVRSMRKVNENGQTPVLVFSVNTGETVGLTHAGRVLVSHGRS